MHTKPAAFVFVFVVMSLLASCVMAEEVREGYHYNGSYYNVLGTDKEQAIANGISDVNSGIVAVISGWDFANTVYIVTKDEQIQPIDYTEIVGCYRFPHLPFYDILPDEHLQKILQLGIYTSVPENEPCLIVSSGDYAAWYNTTVINYAFSHQEVLTEYRMWDRKNMPIHCLPDYPLENVDIFQLWDSEKQPAPGVPEYPW